MPDKELTLRRNDDKVLEETFIDRYAAWACTRTDAPEEYHRLNAVVILSTIMAPSAILPTSFADIRPNIWACILAGTTITRKSTSMNMALKVLDDVHPDYLMATDGSPEGILSELSFREGKVSLFHRDEITGFIKATTTKDYLADLLEAFLKLYDGQRTKRSLRKETIEVKEPRFVILSGGIKTRMQEIISLEHIQSGFIPRFLMVTGSTTVNEMREIGPPAHRAHDAVSVDDPREEILRELFGVVDFWFPKPEVETVVVAGMKKKIEKKAKDLTMSATPETWERIRQLHRDSLTLAENSHSPEIFMPMYQRLADSIIKVAMLLAGAQRKTVIELEDICTAIAYSDAWIQTATNFVAEVEAQPDYNPWEKKAQKIVAFILSRLPETTSRSDVMRKFHVRQRDVDDLEKTLVARGQIKVVTVVGRKADGKAGKARTEYHIGEDFDLTNNNATFRVTPKAEKAPIS